MRHFFHHAWLRLCAFTLVFIPRIALAAISIGDAGGIQVGGSGDNLKTTIINIVQKVLTFVAILAVAMIIFAGIAIIVGNEQVKQTGKKMIIYTIVGLLVIMLASAIVNFVLSIK
ncbi:MAG: TrbC/VirB2 family protein [Candidatus Peribacteraceae bacterium]|nr:TrbC/VirB2 family protein [Candidatus Peribacteraceae bacterium]MDD5074769.1 TrbC/VirB2 family protein [Candidatus Peribacteraceae bacterium]